MGAQIGTAQTVVYNLMSALFSGLFGLLTSILPYAIGVLIFWIGYRFARRALGGK